MSCVDDNYDSCNGLGLFFNTIARSYSELKVTINMIIMHDVTMQNDTSNIIDTCKKQQSCNADTKFEEGGIYSVTKECIEQFKLARKNYKKGMDRSYKDDDFMSDFDKKVDILSEINNNYFKALLEEQPQDKDSIDRFNEQWKEDYINNINPLVNIIGIKYHSFLQMFFSCFEKFINKNLEFKPESFDMKSTDNTKLLRFFAYSNNMEIGLFFEKLQENTPIFKANEKFTYLEESNNGYTQKHVININSITPISICYPLNYPMFTIFSPVSYNCTKTTYNCVTADDCNDFDIESETIIEQSELEGYTKENYQPTPEDAINKKQPIPLVNQEYDPSFIQEIRWFKGQIVTLNTDIDKLQIKDYSSDQKEIIANQKKLMKAWHEINPEHKYKIIDVVEANPKSIVPCLKIVPYPLDKEEQIDLENLTKKKHITVCIPEGENNISHYFTVATKIQQRTYPKGGKKTRRKRVKSKQTRRKNRQKRRSITRRRRRHTKKY